jgi:cell division protein FtsB
MDFGLEKPGKIRVLPTPQQGLRAVLERAPAAEEALNRLLVRLQPAWTVVYSLRRRIATGGILFLTAWLFLHIMFGANGMVVYKEKRAEIDDLQKQVNSLQQENQRYNEQIKSLKTDPKAIEKEAREALHYTRPGEVIYVAPPPVSPIKPATNSAKK